MPLKANTMDPSATRDNWRSEAVKKGGSAMLVELMRSEVESGDLSRVLSILRTLSEDPRATRLQQNRVLLIVSGYAADERHLCEIPAVRQALVALDAAWPYALWFFTWSDDQTSAGLLVLCMARSSTAKCATEKKAADKFCRWLQARVNSIAALALQSGITEDVVTAHVESLTNHIR